MKGPSGKLFDGVYSNPRVTHTIASLVGCIVQLQVKNGEIYEGILNTFSQKVDFALEVVHKVEYKKPGSPDNLLTSEIDPDEVMNKMVFRIEDVVMVSAVNVDLDFATKESGFTDAGISKFNGQVTERVLEPWDGGVSNSDSLTELGNDEVSNGWDPNDMFRTNEVKYGVKSSFDSTLQDYTIPLKKQNTEEYKLQEAKACKIAQEIESGVHYKNRQALENGDEEERFSAVVRPEANATNSSSSTFIMSSNSNRFVTHRSRKPQGVIRPVRSSPSPNAPMGPRIINSHPMQQQQQQTHYHRMSGPGPQAISTQGKMLNSKPVPTGISSAQRPLPQRQIFMSSNQMNSSQQSPSSQLPPMPCRSFAQSANSGAVRNSPTGQPNEDIKINGVDASSSPTSAVPPPVASAAVGPSATRKDASSPETQSNNEVPQSPKEVPEKKIVKKANDDRTEDLKRFHENFKLSDMKEKESKKDTPANVPSVPDVPARGSNTDHKAINDTKSKPEKGMAAERSDESSLSEAMKNSNLNPNAKEFSLNPNAKSFTPRGLSMPSNMLPPPPPPPPPPVQPPPRMHAQSPVIAVPQPHLVPSIPHPVFNMTPHYVVPATPVSLPVAPPYTPASSMAQAPRYRKDQAYGLAMELNECEDVIFSAMPVTFPRTDSSQSIHVQAATGQPILAPHALSTPQFTIQYASPGILHPPPGPPQPQLTYTQMYSMVGHRVIAPQALGMVSATGSYGDSPHVPTQIYMNPQAMAANIAHSGPPGNSGQHSTPSTPQSQTPSLHPAPSPVHQPPPPPSAGPHGQAQTPTGHPSNPPTPHLVYHGQLTAQHLGAAPANHSHHPYSAAAAAAATAAVYGAAPQPIMLLPQQAVTGPHHHHHHHHAAQFSAAAAAAAMQNHFHAQTAGAHSGGGGGGAPTQIIPHPPVAMMPTSTAIAHGQVSLTNSHHYAPHSQV